MYNDCVDLRINLVISGLDTDIVVHCAGVVSVSQILRKGGRKEMFYLTTHLTHFIYGYMA